MIMGVDEVILIIFLLIFEAVWWIIPKTRKKNGNIIIAFKTFPLGMIAFLLSRRLIQKTVRLISDLRMENISISPNWQFSIALLLTIAVIIVSGIFIKRYWGDDKKYNPLPSLGCFALLFIPTAAFSMFLAIMTLGFSISKDFTPSEWDTEWLNLGTKEKIAFESQAIHPFLAEYNYRLCFVKAGKSHRQWLFVNTGGRTHFNIYRLADGRFLFREKCWDYLVDTEKMEVSRLAAADGRIYAALIPNEEIHSWGGPYKSKDKVIMEFGSHKVPAADVTGIFDNVQYCGCIKDRFYSAQEQPESAIDLWRDDGFRIKITAAKRNTQP